jgi:hypothetical protein
MLDLKPSLEDVTSDVETEVEVEKEFKISIAGSTVVTVNVLVDKDGQMNLGKLIEEAVKKAAAIK